MDGTPSRQGLGAGLLVRSARRNVEDGYRMHLVQYFPRRGHVAGAGDDGRDGAQEAAAGDAGAGDGAGWRV
jgi:hypothetical protein